MPRKDQLDPRDVMMEQARVMGLKVDQRWSDETLSEKIAGHTETLAEKEAENIRKNSDTWVLLKKGAFPTSRIKYLAGETVQVPKDMARRWYEAGVAIPADAPE